MPHDEAASLRYIKWQEEFCTEKPYQVLMDVPAGFPTSNFSLEQGPIQKILDIRGQEQRFNLDDNAFAVVNDTLEMTNFEKPTVEMEYFPVVKNILRKSMGSAIKIHIFDWRLRSSDQSKTEFKPGTVVDLNDPLRYLKPVQGVHVDQSAVAARKRVLHHMGDEAEELLKGRFRIVNVWRPLHNRIEDWPLAVCDGGTVSPGKLVAADHVRKTYVGESLYPMFCDEYKWYYLSEQTKDEALLLKTYDSSQNVKAQRKSFQARCERPATY